MTNSLFPDNACTLITFGYFFNSTILFQSW
jgi:hypothetical protein